MQTFSNSSTPLLKISDEIVRIKYDYENTELEKLQNIQIHIDEQFKELESVYGAS